MIKTWLHKLQSTGNLYSLLANGIFSLFGFGTFLVLVRTLSNEVFGQWVLFITVASLLDMLRLGLTGTAAIRLVSSTNALKQKQVVAASYQLGAFSTAAVSIVLFLIYCIGSQLFPNNIYMPIFLYYPLLAIANLPFNQALVWAQGRVDFKQVFIIRLIAGLFSFVIVVSYILFIDSDLIGLIISYIIANAATSLIIFTVNWDGRSLLFEACKNAKKQILQFGKYSTAGYIGSNLLRSSDTILLSLFSFMGPEAISIFAVPFKFVEVVEIPLRSFTATAFPRLSQALKQGMPAFNRMLLSYTTGTTLLLLPFVIVIFLFPDFFLGILGGSSFEANRIIQQQILYLICIYIIILPIDRYSGVALFALDKPALNFYKIISMLIANVVFDLIAIIFFKSLFGVALATLTFTLFGIFLGWYFLFRAQNINLLQIIKNNISFSKLENNKKQIFER